DGTVARQTILNDGSPNCLCLRITNVHPTQPLKLDVIDPKGNRTPAILTLTIPTGDEAWALTSHSEAASIIPETKPGWKQMGKADGHLGGGTALVFTFSPTVTVTTRGT